MEPKALTAINHQLSEFLSKLCSPGAEPVTAGEVAELLCWVLQVGEWLPTATAGEHQRLSRELAEYRSHLMRLRNLLPALQLRLLTERARLESERSHLQAAMEWSTVSRETF